VKTRKDYQARGPSNECGKRKVEGSAGSISEIGFDDFKQRSSARSETPALVSSFDFPEIFTFIILDGYNGSSPECRRLNLKNEISVKV
jgi:hypothetical protein